MRFFNLQIYFFLVSIMRQIISLYICKGFRFNGASGRDCKYGNQGVFMDLFGKLLEIKEMCADYNRKGVLDIIAEIADCSEDSKAILRKISEYVRHSDFEEAENVAAAYLSTFSNTEAKSTSYRQTITRLLDKGVDGLNIAEGLKRYDGDEEIYLKILQSYAGSVRSMLEPVKTVSSDVLSGYKIKIHGIKGASFDIFADQIGMKAEALENAADIGDLNFINEHNPAFLEDAEKLINDVEEMLSAINAENPKPKMDKPDNELLLTLLTSCKDYSLKRVEATMAEIEKYQYQADNGLVDWLRKSIDIMNFQQIVERLSDLNNENE